MSSDSKSPWEILGIDPTDDKWIIKNAYENKLKHCKPESDPQGYVELQQAFEQAKRYKRSSSPQQMNENNPAESNSIKIDPSRFSNSEEARRSVQEHNPQSETDYQPEEYQSENQQDQKANTDGGGFYLIMATIFLIVYVIKELTQ
ncbi:MAG: hypothetical protein MI867_17625 [Pseudomonadales bacterium]|nr:hypothetical protein [Pseudomonadales bacterium]